MADFDKWDDSLEDKLSDKARATIQRYAVLSIIGGFIIGVVVGAFLF